MLSPSSESLLSRFLYSGAVFASQSVMRYVNAQPDQWHLIILVFAFMVGRSATNIMFDLWTPLKPQNAMAKDIMMTLMDVNWTVILYVVMQWVIELVESWWVVLDDIVVASLVTESVIILLVSIVQIVITLQTRRSGQVASVAGVMVSQFSYAMGFFVSSRLETFFDAEPSGWDFLWMVAAFVGARYAIGMVFDLWQPHAETTRKLKDGTVTTITTPHSRGAAALKSTIQENIRLLESIAVFVLVNMFVDMFRMWWFEGEHWINALSAFETVLIIVVAIACWLNATSPNRDAVPDTMINKALFSMSLFVAEKAYSDLQFGFELWHIFWLVIGIIFLQSAVDTAFGMWQPSNRNVGEHALKTTFKKNIHTWITMAVSYIVRLFVSAFEEWWLNSGDNGRSDDHTWIAIMTLQAILLLSISGVKIIGWYDGRYAVQAGSAKYQKRKQQNFGLN